jgi:hypothetical protein
MTIDARGITATRIAFHFIGMRGAGHTQHRGSTLSENTIFILSPAASFRIAPHAGQVAVESLFAVLVFSQILRSTRDDWIGLRSPHHQPDSLAAAASISNKPEALGSTFTYKFLHRS